MASMNYKLTAHIVATVHQCNRANDFRSTCSCMQIADILQKVIAKHSSPLPLLQYIPFIPVHAFFPLSGYAFGVNKTMINIGVIECFDYNLSARGIQRVVRRQTVKLIT